MDLNEFRQQAHQLVDWMADYLQDIKSYPVKSRVSPGTVYRQIADQPPESGESMDSIVNDFKEIILPGITHWQHPNFHAYFTGNSSYPSVLAEMLTATLAAQCMLWETSPAATELEEKMMEWLKKMLALPQQWSGVIQDGASTATLVAILSAREWKSNWNINSGGFTGKEQFSVYCSQQAHSSVEKAVRVAGLGTECLRKIAVNHKLALEMRDLQIQVENDINAGIIPLATIATIGTTGTTAIDPVSEIATVCNEAKMWLHVDAAWAGTALLLPEYRWMGAGLEQADSFVFNPHKWMFTNFDCSAYFVKEPQILLKTFSLVPEYLKTGTKGVNNYSDWGIQLGRRFRALKLWFVIRNFGVDGLRQKIRGYINWARELADKIDLHPDFQLEAPAPLATVCFTYTPSNFEGDPNLLNQQLLQAINDSGSLYLTHTKINQRFIIRLVVGQTYQTREDIAYAWQVIEATAATLKASGK